MVLNRDCASGVCASGVAASCVGVDRPPTRGRTEQVQARHESRASGAPLALLASPHRAKLCLQDRRASRETACAVTSAAGARHSYEYIVDIGTASAQRCQACGRRFWVERKPRECCPKCGGELAETEERRRAIKGGFATRRECEAALAKVLAALEAQTFTPPTKVTVKRSSWASGCPRSKAVCGRPPTQATRCSPASTSSRVSVRLQLQKLSPAAINALYAHLSEHGRVHGGGPLSASSVRRVHAVLHRACHDAVRWGRLTR